MSDIDEPPTKLLKIDSTEEPLSDATDASFLDESMTETVNMPDLPEITDLPEVTDMPVIGLSEVSEIPVISLPEISEMPDYSHMPELTANQGVSDMTETVNKSEMPEISLSLDEAVPTPELAVGDAGMEMVEEQLQNSSEMIEEQLQDSSEMVEERLEESTELDQLMPNDLIEKEMVEERLQEFTMVEERLLESTNMVVEPLQESTDMVEERLQESTDMVEERLQESTDMVEEHLQESTDMVEERLQDSMEMVEERLHDTLESQEAQENQEEWLSEGMLTDDDYHSTAVQTKTVAPQGPTPKLNGTSKPNLIPHGIEAKVERNIEDALNSLEGRRHEHEVPEGLEEFMITKSEPNTDTPVVKTENGKEDDGNDTDDLLRMLGGDDSKTKKLTKTVKDLKKEKAATSSDDDRFVFEGASAKKVKLAIRKDKADMRSKKQPTKAAPEESDASSDEAATRKSYSKKSNSSQRQAYRSESEAKAKTIRYQESQARSIVNVMERPRKEKVATSTPCRPAARSLLKPAATPRAAAAAPRAQPASVQVKREPNPNTYSRVNKSKPQKASLLKPVVKEEPLEDVADDEEYLDEEEYHLKEEDFESDDDDLARHRIMQPEQMDEDALSDGDSHSEDGSIYDVSCLFESDDDDLARHRIMQPEQMDEDALSDDGDSHSEDGSIYDELPSSDSEDLDDWFQLDIRAEKAGDYLPLLGPNAMAVLLEEKERVAERLSNLKKSLSALTDSGKKQAEQVRTATLALAELDDMLKST